MTDNFDEIDTESPEFLKEQLSQAEENVEYYRESFDQAVASMSNLQDVGWNLINGVQRNEFNLLHLQRVSEFMREWVETNPLLGRALELRCSYLFNDDYEVTSETAGKPIPPRLQKVFDKPKNQAAVFGIEALARAEKDRFCNGQHFVAYDKTKQEFTVIPFWWIADAVFNPDDYSDMWFYKVRYTRSVLDPTTGVVSPTLIEAWYQTDTSLGNPEIVPGSGKINGVSIDRNKVMIDHRVNTRSGGLFGIPDGFNAAPWALAYSNYLRDGTKVMSALAEWAWQITPKTKAGADKMGAKLGSGRAGAAGRTAVTDMDMKPLPKAGQVDLDEARPIAAQVAAATGVSVVLLLSDPGSGGSYGTALTLEDPTLKSMAFRQAQDEEFLERCISVIGYGDFEVELGDMAQDAQYRRQQTLNFAWGTGLFWPDEMRGEMAETSDIELSHSNAPTGIITPNNKNGIVGLSQAEIAAAKDGIAAAVGTPGAAVPGAAAGGANAQGQNNANVGKTNTGANDLKNADSGKGTSNVKASTAKNKQ